MGKAADVVARLEPHAQPHRRQVRVRLVAGEVRGRIDVGVLHRLDRETQRVVDDAFLRGLVVPHQARQDRQAGRVGGRPGAGRCWSDRRPRPTRRASGRHSCARRRPRRAAGCRGREPARGGRRRRASRRRPPRERPAGSGTVWGRSRRRSGSRSAPWAGRPAPPRRGCRSAAVGAACPHCRYRPATAPAEPLVSPPRATPGGLGLRVSGRARRGRARPPRRRAAFVILHDHSDRRTLM